MLRTTDQREALSRRLPGRCIALGAGSVRISR